MKTENKVATNKADKAKKRFLRELKGALRDVKKAESLAGKPFDEAFKIVKEAHGGARAGAKKSEIKKVQRGVKLSEPEYRFIVKKYGTFAGGVRSLLPENLV